MTTRSGAGTSPPPRGFAATRAAAVRLMRGQDLAEPHLLVAAGPDAGRRHPLRSPTTIGRGRSADLRLADPAVSRLHARVARGGDRWIAEDLGARNGLRVNGRALRGPHPLAPGDELELGETRLRLEAGLLAELDDGAAAPADRALAAGSDEAAPRRTGPGRGVRSRLGPLAVAAALAAAAALLLGP